MALAGILGFVPITIILAVVLLNLEGVVSLHKSPLSSPMNFGN